MILFLLFVLAYLAGSLNVPIVLFRLLGREDPRSRFSKNPGMTNVYRQAGIWWALLVLVLEMGKSVILVLTAMALLPKVQIPFVGLGLIVGNKFPCFHGFQGGKGVANYLGVTLPVAPMFAVVAMIFWPIVFYTIRQPFVGSFIMVAILAVGMLVKCSFATLSWTSTILTVIIIYGAHLQNLLELLSSRRTKNDL